MRTAQRALIVVLAALGFGIGSTRGVEPASAPAHARFTKVHAKWEKIMPDLGEMSPEIAILRVDPKSEA